MYTYMYIDIGQTSALALREYQGFKICFPRKQIVHIRIPQDPKGEVALCNTKINLNGQRVAAVWVCFGVQPERRQMQVTLCVVYNLVSSTLLITLVVYYLVR